MGTNTSGYGGWTDPLRDHVVIDNRRLDDLAEADARTAADVEHLAASQRRQAAFSQALTAGMSPEQARGLLGLPERKPEALPEPMLIEQAGGTPLVVYPGERINLGMLRGSTGVRRR